MESDKSPDQNIEGENEHANLDEIVETYESYVEHSSEMESDLSSFGPASNVPKLTHYGVV